jgi:putative transposase
VLGAQRSLDHRCLLRDVTAAGTGKCRAESINARIRRAVNARGHFPEQAALKRVYLAIMSLDPTGKGQQRWSNRWKAALNAFETTFDGRLSTGRK